jgi:hypothetical protein
VSLEPNDGDRELRARVLELARQNPSATRSSLLARRALAFAGLALLPIAGFLAWGGVRGGPRPDALVFETAVGAALIALGAAFVAFGRGGSMLGRSRTSLLLVIVLTPLALFAWKLATSAAYPGMMTEWVGRPGLRCLRMSCLLSAAPLIGALVILRRSAPVHPALLGMAIGAAIGGASWVLVDLWCPVAHVHHLLLGHVLPLGLSVALGGLLGQRVLSVRAQSQNDDPVHAN